MTNLGGILLGNLGLQLLDASSFGEDQERAILQMAEQNEWKPLEMQLEPLLPIPPGAEV